MLIDDKVRAVLRHAVGCNIAGCGTQNAWAFGDGAYAVGAVCWGAKKEHNVQPLGGQINFAIGHAKADIRVWVGFFEIGNGWGNEAAANSKGGRHLY